MSKRPASCRFRNDASVFPKRENKMNCLGNAVHSLVLRKLALKHFPANGTADEFQGEEFYFVNAR